MSELPDGFFTADHSVLFQESEPPRCDACGESLAPPSAADVDDGGEGRGRGMLVWSRGEERRYQEAPLCSECAVAIGVSALQRWEIEEEEG